jgi:uncharacterized protein
MTRNEIVGTLAAHRAELARRGVRSLALFGSTARDEARPASDVDLLVDLAPAAGIDLFDLMDIRNYLAELLHRPVDLVIRGDLKPHVRDNALRDAVHVF